jgi:hypothetical protein
MSLITSFPNYGPSLLTGIGTKFWPQIYNQPFFFDDIEAKSLSFNPGVRYIQKTSSYYEKLTLIYCPFTPENLIIHDYNDKKGIEKSKKKGHYNTPHSFLNDGSVSFEIVNKNLITKPSTFKKTKFKTRTFNYLKFNGIELKINNKTLNRLISTCVINKSKIETPIIFLKERRSWFPYSINDYTVKQAMNPAIKCNKSKIGDLTLDLKFDDKEYQKVLEVLNRKNNVTIQ